MKCLKLARASSANAEKKEQKNVSAAAEATSQSSRRRRHKTAADKTFTESVKPLRPLSQDDILLHRQSSTEVSDTNGESQRSVSMESMEALVNRDGEQKEPVSLETKSEKIQAVDSVLMGECVYHCR